MRELHHRIILKINKYFDVGPILWVLRRIRYLSQADKKLILTPKKSFTYQNTRRYYLLHPAAKTPRRIVLALHAVRDSAKLFAYYSSLHNTVDEHTVVVYPEATWSWWRDQGWNAKICCGPAMRKEIDDIGFLAALIEFLQNTFHSTQPLPVYLVGYSNGGMLAQYFATKYPELCAGVFCFAASCGNCHGTLVPATLPFPVALAHGTEDEHIPFFGGSSEFNDYGPWYSFDEMLSFWESAAGIHLNRVWSRVLRGVGHVWPGWRVEYPDRLHNFGAQLVTSFITYVEGKVSPKF